MLVRVVPSTLVAAVLMVAPVSAQTQPKAPPKAQPTTPPTIQPQARPKAPPTAETPANPAAPVQSVASPAKAPEPAVDEGTAQRMAAALLSYSAIEVRGGWPTVPANAKLAPGGSAPEVASKQAGALIASWIAINARVLAFRGVIRYVLLLSGLGFVVSLFITRVVEADILAGEETVAHWFKSRSAGQRSS